MVFSLYHIHLYVSKYIGFILLNIKCENYIFITTCNFPFMEDLSLDVIYDLTQAVVYYQTFH